MRTFFRPTVLLYVAANAWPAFAAGLSIAAVVNGASYETGAVAPGSIAAVFGTFLVNSLVTAPGASLPTSLGGVSLQAGTTAFPLFFVAGNQADVQISWELSGQTQATVSATAGGQNVAFQGLKLAPFAPGIFSTNAQGSGQGAILDGSYRLVDGSNPASVGTTVQIYCTGLGPVTNQPASGTPSPSSPLAMTISTPTVTVGGLAAPVLFSGLAPGFVGLYQVNVEVPAATPGGSAVPVAISIGGAVSNTVTIAVSPPSATVLPGRVQSFGGTVAGVRGGGVIAWSIREGSDPGCVLDEKKARRLLAAGERPNA